MDADRKQRIIDYLNTHDNEMLHVVDGNIEVRSEWRARMDAEHMADTANYDWCDCPLHDPRP